MESSRRVRSVRSSNVRRSIAALVAGAAGLATASTALGQAVTTAFTYQGELQSGGTAVDGAYDLRFRLYDAVSGGTQLGTTQCVDNVPVVGGRFTVQLDFGGQFAGQQRFLDIQVRSDTGQNCSNATGFTLMTPRQGMTATPYATFAPAAGNAGQLNGQGAAFYQDAGNLTSGTIPDGRMASNVVRTNFSNSFTGTNVFTGFTTFSGAIQSTNPASVYVGDGAGLSGLWRLGGNSGTNPATQFLGTTDNAALSVRTNNQEVLRITPSGTIGSTFSPNIVAGSPANSIALASSNGAAILSGGNTTNANFILGTSNQGVIAGGINNGITGGVAATIGGGNTNRITNNFATIGGGQDNTAGGPHSTISGGVNGTASAQWSVVGGGIQNSATGDGSVVAGGGWNAAPGPGGAVVGGQFGVASGYTAAVLGGTSNIAQGAYATAAGRRAQALHDGSFVWGDSTDADFASATPNQFLIRAGGGVGINTNTTIGSASLVVRGTLLGNGYGGLYADTPDVIGRPFLGYATAGGYRAWTQYDGATGEWSLAMPFVSGNTLPMKVSASGDMAFSNRVAINTPVPGSRLDVRGDAVGGVNVFTGDLAPFGAAGYEANFSAAGIGGNSLLWLGVDSAQRFNVASVGDAFLSRDFYAGGFVSATGSVQAQNGNVLAGTLVTLDQSSAVTGRPEVRMASPGWTDKVGLSEELGGSYVVVNLDNNFRMEGRASDADAGAVRIDGRPNGVQMFQFWSRNPNFAPEVLAASLTESGAFAAAGSISAPAKFFHIDHPSDPANKTLRHACVESDEYKNIYDGVVTTDGAGYATISLPSWMTDLNENFRYQLTVIDESDSGDPLMWARVARKVDASNTFVVRTSSAGMEVSWQVTGTRKDAWAKAHPFTPEEAKVGTDKGKYLSPESFGRPASDGMNTGEAFEARAAAAASTATKRTPAPTDDTPSSN